MKKYEAVIFDLDGTLLDTLDDLADSVNHCMEMFGFPLHTKDEVRSFVGNGIRKLIERAIPDGLNNPLYEEVYQEEAGFYRDHSQVKTKAYDGIMDMLERLKEQEMKMAIVSNKNDDAAKVLGQIYFKDQIPVVIGATDQIAKKPEPDTVFQALKELGVSPRKALYVGDSEVDSMTAINAGMDCILVTWGFREKEFLSKHVAIAMIDHPSELLAYLS